MIHAYKQIYNIYPSEKRRTTMRSVIGNADDVSE